MKIGIIGFGMVGKETLHLLYRYPLVKEVLITNLHAAPVNSEIQDLEDSFSYIPSWRRVQVSVAKDYTELLQCDIVVITASVPHKPTGDRLDALLENGRLLQEIGEQFRNAPAHLKVIVVSNPADAMAQVFLRSSGLPKERVISSGTNLETSRLKVFLSEWGNLAISDIQTFVLGEHGQSACIPWSLTRIAGLSIDEYTALRKLPTINKEEFLRKVRMRAWDIIEGKNYTDRGIAASVVQIINSIATDEKKILPVGVLLEGQYGIQEVLLSVPCILGSSGIEQILEVPLLDSEKEELVASANVLKEARDKLSAI